MEIAREPTGNRPATGIRGCAVGRIVLAGHRRFGQGRTHLHCGRWAPGLVVRTATAFLPRQQNENAPPDILIKSHIRLLTHEENNFIVSDYCRTRLRPVPAGIRGLPVPVYWLNGRILQSGAMLMIHPFILQVNATEIHYPFAIRPFSTEGESDGE